MSDELHVFEVRVDFKYDVEEIRSHFLAAIKRELGGFYPGKHGKATITLLMTRSGTHTDLSNRLAAVLEQVRGVDNHWVSYAPRSIAAKHSADPFAHYLRVAWEKVGEANQSQHMRKAQRLRRFTERKVQNG
jgi:hypothetical protein